MAVAHRRAGHPGTGRPANPFQSGGAKLSYADPRYRAQAGGNSNGVVGCRPMTIATMLLVFGLFYFQSASPVAPSTLVTPTGGSTMAPLLRSPSSKPEGLLHESSEEEAERQAELLQQQQEQEALDKQEYERLQEQQAHAATIDSGDGSKSAGTPRSQDGGEGLLGSPQEKLHMDQEPSADGEGELDPGAEATSLDEMESARRMPPPVDDDSLKINDKSGGEDNSDEEDDEDETKAGGETLEGPALEEGETVGGSALDAELDPSPNANDATAGIEKDEAEKGSDAVSAGSKTGDSPPENAKPADESPSDAVAPGTGSEATNENSSEKVEEDKVSKQFDEAPEGAGTQDSSDAPESTPSQAKAEAPVDKPLEDSTGSEVTARAPLSGNEAQAEGGALVDAVVVNVTSTPTDIDEASEDATGATMAEAKDPPMGSDQAAEEAKSQDGEQATPEDSTLVEKSHLLDETDSTKSKLAESSSEIAFNGTETEKGGSPTPGDKGPSLKSSEVDKLGASTEITTKPISEAESGIGGIEQKSDGSPKSEHDSTSAAPDETATESGPLTENGGVTDSIDADATMNPVPDSNEGQKGSDTKDISPTAQDSKGSLKGAKQVQPDATDNGSTEKVDSKSDAEDSQLSTTTETIKDSPVTQTPLEGEPKTEGLPEKVNKSKKTTKTNDKLKGEEVDIPTTKPKNDAPLESLDAMKATDGEPSVEKAKSSKVKASLDPPEANEPASAKEQEVSDEMLAETDTSDAKDASKTKTKPSPAAEAKAGSLRGTKDSDVEAVERKAKVTDDKKVKRRRVL